MGSEGEDRESVRASVETGKEMGLFGLLDAEELKKFEEGASPSSSSSPSPVLPTLTASSGGAFCLPSSNSVSSSEPLSASSPHFPTLSPTFSTSSPPSHPPAPPSSRKNDDGEGEKEAIRCIHQIMKNFAAQQKVMREKIKLQRDLIHLFEGLLFCFYCFVVWLFCCFVVFLFSFFFFLFSFFFSFSSISFFFRFFFGQILRTLNALPCSSPSFFFSFQKRKNNSRKLTANFPPMLSQLFR